MRSFASAAVMMVFAACAVELPATDPASRPTSSGAEGSGQPAAGCECYFETWSLRMPCGTRCMGDAKLVCTASGASVQPSGCAVPGADAGTPVNAVDAGLSTDDAGPAQEDVDGGPACTASLSSCSCTIYPYESPTLSFIVPCCVTMCLESQTRAWVCTAGGETQVISHAVCR